MLLADVARRRPLWVAVLIGAIVGTLIGLFLPIRAADPPSADAERWVLPDAQALARFHESDYERIRSARFWGELAMRGRGSGNKVQEAWEVTGIVTRPTVQVAVGQVGKSPQTWVRIGGSLPDGGTLVAVNRDRIWFEKDGCRHVRSLYQDKTRPDPTGCVDASGRPVATEPAATDAADAAKKPPRPRSAASGARRPASQSAAGSRPNQLSDGT